MNKGEMLRSALERKGLKPSDLAHRLDASSQKVNHWFSRGVPRNYAYEVAELLSVSPSDISDVIFNHAADSPAFVKDKANMDKLLSKIYTPVIDLVEVPQIDAAMPIGPGNVLTGDAVIRVWKIESALLLREGIDPPNALLVAGSGDAMAPLINDGDIVLIDCGAAHLSGEAIYAIDTGHGVRLKRIAVKMDGSIVISSENRDKYPAEKYTASEAEDLFRIIGTARIKCWAPLL